MASRIGGVAEGANVDGVPSPPFNDVCAKDFLGFEFNARSYNDQLQAAIARTETVCAMSAAVVRVGNTDTVWMKHDFKFLGGSLGCAEGEVLCRGFEFARQHRLPVVVVCQSGGARMQEGTLSLMQLGKVSVCVESHKAAGLPFVCVLKDPTYGGVPASYAMQADVRIGIQGGRIGESEGRGIYSHLVTG